MTPLIKNSEIYTMTLNKQKVGRADNHLQSCFKKYFTVTLIYYFKKI